jgi:hypothetical protein
MTALVRKPKNKDYLEDLDTDGSIILKWLLHSVGGSRFDSRASG